MTTVIERDTGGSSAVTMLVGIVAIVVILGLALYFFQVFPFAERDSGGTGIDVNIEGQIPTGNDGQ